MTFNYDLQPKTPAKAEKDHLWNAKLRKLSLREKQHSIRITLPAGSYDNKAIIEIINNTIQNDATIKSFREETKFDLSTEKSVYLELPKIIDLYGRTAIQLQEEIINVSMSRELAFSLGFVNHPSVWLKFSGGGGRGGDTFKTPSPYEQLLTLPTPCFKMFLERSLNDPLPPTTPLQAPFTYL